MTPSARELVGHLVVTVQEGRHLGRVTDIYVDTEQRKVTGLVFRANPMANRKWVDGTDTELFGDDVVLVWSAENASTEVRDLVIRGRSLSELFSKESRHVAVNREEIRIGPDQISVPASYASRIVATESVGVFGRLFRRSADDESEDVPTDKSA